MKKIAAIQMCSISDVAVNLAHAAALVKEAALQGASLAVLPEMFVYFGKEPCDKIPLKDSSVSDHIRHFLSALAKQYRIIIVAGTIPMASSHPNKIRAAAFVYDENGQEIARYDKIHLFDVILSLDEKYQESDTTDAGTEVIVVNTAVGNIGLCVCYDLRFTAHIAALYQKGAEIIVVPAAFTAKTGAAHWEILARCRAIDAFCYVVGACQEGVHPDGRKTHGHSLIVDPWGQIVAERIHPGEGVVYADVDLKKLYEIRQQIPIHTAL